MAAGILSAKDVSHIEKFNGDNLSFYKFKLKLVLGNHGLLSMIEGTEEKEVAIVADDTNSNAAVVPSIKATIVLREKKDTTEQNYIVSTLKDKITRTIMNCTSAKFMWDRLLAQYELASIETKHMLLGKLMSYPFDVKIDIMTHVSAIECLAVQLKDMKSPVSNDQIIAKITGTLQLVGELNYKAFITSWNSSQEHLKTLPLLVSKLQVEETLQKTVDLKVESSDGAFFADKEKGRSSDPKSRDSKPEVVRPKSSCEYCRKLNRRSSYREEDCWIKEAYLRGKREAATGTGADLMFGLFSKNEDITFDFDVEYASKHADLDLRLEC